jgi:DNA-binding NtrC family response regulator
VDGTETIPICFYTSDLDFCESIQRGLGEAFEVWIERRCNPGRTQEQERWSDVVLLDTRKQTLDVRPLRIQLLREIRRRSSPPAVIAVVDANDHPLIRQVFDNGGHDMVECPISMDELRFALLHAHKFQQVEKEIHPPGPVARLDQTHPDFVVHSEAMQQVLALTRKVAPNDISVLITGETGTGKELLAREIHRLSSRACGPFVAFSCANLPETLIEDELFGHEKGAFTGATAARRGRIEVADQGTLFLDEIGDVALGLQAKLLRVLQQRSFERLGSNTTLKSNFRLVCATFRDLKAMADQGEFRRDLYYRLNVVQIFLPPLRERQDGIAVLADHFLRQSTKELRKRIMRFSVQSLRALEEYSWPGNVRELENVVQRAVVMAEGKTIEPWHLPPEVGSGFAPSAAGRQPLDGEVRQFKRRVIMRTLREFGGNTNHAAKALGVTRSHLYRLISQLHISRQDGPLAADDVSDTDASLPPLIH